MAGGLPSSFDCGTDYQTTCAVSPGMTTTCEKISTGVTNLLGDFGSNAGEEIALSYSCTGVGHPDRPESLRLFEVTVSLNSVGYRPFLNVFLDSDLVIQRNFSATRVTEDLDTI